MYPLKKISLLTFQTVLIHLVITGEGASFGEGGKGAVYEHLSSVYGKIPGLIIVVDRVPKSSPRCSVETT